MDIHKPKPIRNWRDFLKEVGIIVLGVSIALAAEQAVQYVHWRGDVVQARAFLSTEIARDTANAISRLRTQSCTEHRLDELAAILDLASQSGRLPPVGAIGQPPRRGWSIGTWDSVMASQVNTHFSGRQLQGLAYFYNFVRNSMTYSDQEIQAWSDINSMAGPGRRLDPVGEDRLRAAISTARSLNRAIAFGAIRMTELASAATFSKQDRDYFIAPMRKNSLTEGQYNIDNGITPMFDICRPLGAVPAHYGDGILPGVPAVMPEVLKTMPKFDGH
jgi:hypothetical protein